MSAGVMAGLQLVGQVAGPVLGGIEERSALRASAAADRENARRSEFQGELDAWQSQREARLAQGSGLAVASADGNVVGTGSIADLVEQAALERELEIGNLRARARGEAMNLRTSAANKSSAAGMALFKGVLGGALSYATLKADRANQGLLKDAAARDRASRVPAPRPVSRGQWDGALPTGRVPWGSLPSGRG
jgi:hypothetical protein